MENKEWFAKEEDWILKRPIIFNRNLVMLTFIEIDRLIRLLGDLPPGSRVLDLCCGIGRHSLEFARHGFDVTGVDITAPYLEIAREKAAKEGLSIRLVHSDMKEFCEPGAFDLIANLCTSFGYFEDIEDDFRVLKNVWRSLAPNGKFVIEILGKEVIASTFRPLEELEFEDCKVVAESAILNDWSTLQCKRKITHSTGTDEITAYHRLYSATELKKYLRDAGFGNIKVYGNFAGAPYDNQAKSMIMVAEK